MKFLFLILENVRRNLLRTILTGLGTVVLVGVVALIWSILAFLDDATREKPANFKAVVTERWRLPSQLPYAYVESMKDGGRRQEGDANHVQPLDWMTWTFVLGTVKPGSQENNDRIFFFAMEPDKLTTMMDELDSLPPGQKEAFAATVEKLKANRQGVILGRDRLKALNKRVGDRINVYGINYAGIDFEMEIVGEFPPGRYDPNAAMNIDYFQRSMDDYERKNKKKHPMYAKSLNLVWLKVPNREEFDKLANQILTSPDFANPAVKIETAASGTAAFLEPLKDILNILRYGLVPACIASLALVISNAISISVRERQTEFAVLKVLGFRPNQVLALVLSEAIVIGALSGLAGAGLTYLLVNKVFGGIRLPIAFFSAFYIRDAALWWGPAIGIATALAGSFLPAWTARRVRVSEVFSRVG